jgi:hypothetical protein
MPSLRDLYETNRRLAKYYLEELRRLEERYEQGNENISPALLQLVEQWPQIVIKQKWSAQHAKEDEEAAELCSAFADGSDLLNLHQDPIDRVRWSEAGLEAARILQRDEAIGAHLVVFSI